MNNVFILPDIDSSKNGVDSPPLFTLRNSAIEHIYWGEFKFIKQSNIIYQLLINQAKAIISIIVIA